MRDTLLQDKIALENYDLELLEFSKELLKKLDIHSTIHISKKRGTESKLEVKFTIIKTIFMHYQFIEKRLSKTLLQKLVFL